jgi:hypothetical protein
LGKKEVWVYMSLTRGVQILGIRSPGANKFFTLAPNICGSSSWKYLHVTFLVPKICLLLFWKIFTNFFSALGLVGSGHLHAPATLVKRKFPPVPNGEEEDNRYSL